MENLQIFQFTDYHTFLREYFLHQKKINPRWSYGMWARKLGISSTAVLTNITNGKRTIGKSIQDKFIKYFNFNDFEEEYFKNLIKLEKLKDDPDLSISIMEKMSQFRSGANFRLLDSQSFNSISNWYYYAIREMVELPHFIEDYNWIADNLMFKTSATEVEKAINDLLNLKLLERDSDGSLKSTNETTKTSEDIASEGLKRFHEQMIKNAAESIRKIDLTKRDISGRTINIDSRKIPRAKQFIREFRNKFAELFEEPSGDNTYQLNVQLFPLTK